MAEYIDRVLINLRRQYGKDEYVSHLIKGYKESQLEVGKLTSERDEALYKLEKALKMDHKARSRYGQTQIYKDMKAQIKDLKELNKKLQRDNLRLLEKVAKLQVLELKRNFRND